MTEETKLKISLSLKGRKKTKETKMKMSLSQKGKKLTEETKNRISLSRKGKKPTDATRRRISLAHRGKKNHGWKGGISPIRERVRNSAKYAEWRQKVFIRDDFTCQDCRDKTGGNLEAHHIKSFKELLQEVKKYLPLFNLYDGAMAYTPMWDTNNGITLCEKCHDNGRRIKND